MQNWFTRTTASVGILVIFTLVSWSAFAEPVGALAELNPMGEQMLTSHGKSAADIEQEIPSRQTVGLPVYPGAVYTGAMEGTGILPSIIMASADPVEKIREWYANQPGFSYHDQLRLFYIGDEYVMMESESVYLQDISENPSASTGGLMFNMAGMKTQFTISYKPKN